MLFSNYLLFIYIVSFVVIYTMVRSFTKSVLLRNGLIAIANVLLLLNLVKEHTIIVLAILSLIVYVLGRLLQTKNSKALLSFSLSLIIVLFIVRNYSAVQSLLSHSFLSFLHAPILSVQKLGLSYILFRFVHWLIESFKQKIQKPNFLTFINYILFFPSILAGPIDTYNNFQYWIGKSNASYSRSLFFAGISRIFIGALKTLGLVPLIIHYATDYSVFPVSIPPLMALFMSLICYSFYIYLDFSGYSDIAIGTAYLIGIKTPENFNNPYRSQNLSEFWKRWHMTFSSFLQLYVFKPFIQLFNTFLHSKNRLLITILSYLATFVICGLWHGATINFVYWGLWHGFGLSINKIWLIKMKPHVAFSGSKTYQFLSIVLTFLYISMGWLFFHYSSAQLVNIFKLF